ncbi:MAG: NAD(P)/FAD-dependent oxidoreductase [Oculatellaceae cyanobacterium Prado106]|jgi:phytoene dehydrogenase-like protein|nr:NAD(P)/FAD-dependent oxidoreductase [Oculatellaceae cyanobacterium Prado106]
MKADTEILVIGSGIGGLSCAALLASYGFQVTVCESHSIPGGAAHGFERRGFQFDSGPSLYSGLSYSPSPNPLRQILDAIAEPLPCLPYKTWGCWLPEGHFDMDVGAEPFLEVLQQMRGDRAVQEWRTLQRVMEPLSKAAIALPLTAIRFDPGALLTIGRYAPRLLSQLPALLQVTGSFDRILNATVQDPFIRNWLNLLCFMLSGLPAAGTSTAEIAFMFADWYRPDVILDYPMGGSAALVNALVRGLEKHGGKLRLNAHVSEIVVEQGRAAGVRLKNGEILRAERAVVSNAVIWDTLNLLPSEHRPDEKNSRGWGDRTQTPACPSFMHLHLGIDATGIDPALPCHHMIVNDWERGVTAPQNVVAVSIPSLLDETLAPPGRQVVHVYTPATEPYELWQGLDRSSAAYAELKQSRAEVMWQALERFIPDIRQRCEVTLVGTPLTHERFLRRYRGSYGPALSAQNGLFPSSSTPIPGLWCCGDSTFPGIGLPAVAASGMIAANAIAPLQKHLDLLAKLG